MENSEQERSDSQTGKVLDFKNVVKRDLRLTFLWTVLAWFSALGLVYGLSSLGWI